MVMDCLAFCTASAPAPQVPLWAQVAGLVSVPILAFLGTWIGTRSTRTSAVELGNRERREELMRTVRWAAEQAVSKDLRTSKMGMAALGAMESSPLLQPEDETFIAAVSDSVASGARQAYRQEQAQRQGAAQSAAEAGGSQAPEGAT